MKVLILSIVILMTSCVTTIPASGCGYARSQQKNLKKYHRQHRHHR